MDLIKNVLASSNQVNYHVNQLLSDNTPVESFPIQKALETIALVQSIESNFCYLSQLFFTLETEGINRALLLNESCITCVFYAMRQKIRATLPQFREKMTDLYSTPEMNASLSKVNIILIELDNLKTLVTEFFQVVISLRCLKS